MISYPNIVHGWYYSPEAAMVRGIAGATIHEGWEWIPEDEDERPWKFLEETYQTRLSIKESHPLLAMAFKLGPNSLYGKYAQTVGWDQDKRLPPKSHALPVAGWVTSFCRAVLWTVMRQVRSSVIAVETDSVFTTTDPRSLDLVIGKGLGEWGFNPSTDVYDEMLYLQNGMYHIRKGEQWSGVKSRGMTAREFPHVLAEEFLSSLIPGEQWGTMTIPTKPRFIGAGAALASSVPFREIFTSWRSQTKEIGIGDTGKRVHVPKACPQCSRSIGPDTSPHRLCVRSRSDGRTLSFPRTLPWEKTPMPAEVLEMRRELEIQSELIQT